MVLQEDLRSRSNGAFILINRDHVAKKFPSHWHQFGEIMAVNEGIITVTIGGKPYQVSAGSFLFIFPCELHSIEASEQSKSILIQYDSTLLSAFSSIAIHTQKYGDRLHYIGNETDPEMNAQMHALLDEILLLRMQTEEGENPPSFSDVRQYMLLSQMLMLVFEKEMAEPVQPGSVQTSRNALMTMQDICQYISHNYTEEITQAQMAERAEMSISYFSRAFREYTGTSFTTYLSRCRLAYAKQLLASHDMKITDVAFLAGFGSLASFNRVFLELENMTPSDFRRLHNTG